MNRFNTQADHGNFKYVEKFMIMMAGVLTHLEEIEKLENRRTMPMTWSAKKTLPTIRLLEVIVNLQVTKFLNCLHRIQIQAREEDLSPVPSKTSKTSK
ncbi:hypothetical protein K3495_g3608 [Podosphaera aphanis]|nr:hypothetical protein K3495_g3608 [Podosphaera aphanis]